MSLHIKRTLVVDILKYGLPLNPAVLMKWGQGNSIRYILLLSIPLSQIAIYGVALRFAAILAIVDSAFRMAYDPFAIKLFGQPNSEKQFSLIFSGYLAALFILCTVISAFSGPLIHWVAGPDYKESSHFVGYLGFGLLWLGATNNLAAGNQWAKKTYWNGIGFSLGAMVTFILLYITAPIWGLLTAGVTFLVGSLVATVFILATSQKNHKINYNYLHIGLAMLGSIMVPTISYYIESYNFNSIYVEIVSRGLLTIIPTSILIILCMKNRLAFFKFTKQISPNVINQPNIKDKF